MQLAQINCNQTKNQSQAGQTLHFSLYQYAKVKQNSSFSCCIPPNTFFYVKHYEHAFIPNLIALNVLFYEIDLLFILVMEYWKNIFTKQIRLIYMGLFASTFDCDSIYNTGLLKGL